MKNKIKMAALFLSMVMILSSVAVFAKEDAEVNEGEHISYTTHVENIGWQDYVSDGEQGGTTGQALRLEGIKIKLEGNQYEGGVEYRTHIENIGWEEDYTANDEMSGTTGRALRLEAIQIRLTGEIAEYYDIYYRVHAENLGWMGWAKNDAKAGTARCAYRLEGIEIKLVKKDEAAPGDMSKAFYEKKAGYSDGDPEKFQISYTTHVENIGWQEYVLDGDMAGTSGKALRLEGIQIRLLNAPYEGTIEYKTHIENIGWETDYKTDNEMSGTTGRALRLEAIQIQLTGELAEHYDIYYCVHAEHFGWMGWTSNGESAGTAGYAYRLEGIKIKLVNKGESIPDQVTGNKYTSQPFTEKNKVIECEHNWVEQKQTIHHDAVTHEEPVYEQQWVVDSEAWDEPIYEKHPVCSVCGQIDPDNDHALQHMLNGEGSGYRVKRVQVGTTHHEETGHYEQVQIGTTTVTDSAAWDETVTTGYKCSKCGEEQNE